jgi:hypothetical protein
MTQKMTVMKPCPDCGSSVTRSEYVPARIENYVLRIRSQYEQNSHLGYLFQCDFSRYELM